MRTLIGTFITILACAMPALAAGPANENGSVLILLFIGFGVLILVSQLFPGVALFAVMFKEIFTGSGKKTVASSAKGPK